MIDAQVRWKRKKDCVLNGSLDARSACPSIRTLRNIPECGSTIDEPSIFPTLGVFA
jgi:hypothetical protein